ncbi:transcriptional regulator ATRX homolog [Pseudochaenichthys georgianus]|uniref:transcriptional regulator ATRX homolog n=1 Tax=Pseudochaenichthys georgianus TaxID=52239 RepID=UPI00146AA85F|nr:glutamic acid-rich protein-like [Pseudochaenichthys georgianus]
MTRVSSYLNWTTNPPGYVEKASRYVKSSMGQGRDDEVPEGPAGADSDSGDSLFITQKPVPEALRTGVRTRYSQWAKPLSPRDLHESEESEENKESSDSNDGESQSGKVQRSKKNVLPKFSFPFLKEKKPELLPVHNKRLHSYLVGGFFECVRLLRQGCQTKKDVESSLPTVDMDGEHISQLSEDDGEKLDEADIKVVERKLFVVPSKSRRKKKSSAAEDVRQEKANESFETDVRAEHSLASVICKMEDKHKEKKIQKRVEDIEQLETVTEPPNADAETRKKKKEKRKKQGIATTKECEEEEASNRTLDLPPMSPENLEGLENCSENAVESQETLESSCVKKKNYKKKRVSCSKEATQGLDISCGNGNEKVDNTQKTKEGLEDQNANLTEKIKKKKKRKEILSSNLSEDNSPQSDDLVSVQEKEEKRTSSFRVADAEDNDAQTPVELNDNGVRKKRKLSAAQDSVEINPEQGFEEPNTGVKRKKKETGNETESVTPAQTLKSAGDVEFSPTDETVVLKKKKKKKSKVEPCNVIQEDPSASKDVESVKSSLKDCSSHKRKDKRAPSAETFHSETEMLLSDSIVERKNVRRKLHNPIEDFYDLSA